ncbi:MAG: PEP-CTERM sorting domain-containing protein [Myxococcota bacterium]|nr:PEP-CTERM sorting domain-containing protein [Myxococcota bacterium]
MSRRTFAGLFGFALLIAWAGPAAATPVNVFFNGPSGYGMSENSALAANSQGIPFIAPVVFGTAESYYGFDQDLGSSSPNPPTTSDNRATSSWKVKNISTESFNGTSYLVFTHIGAYAESGVPIEYHPDKVGLEIDADLAWSILAVHGGQNMYYYPMIELKNLDGPNDFSDAFDVKYIVQEPLIEAPSSYYNLPQLMVSRGFTPIPEPTTAMLFAAGLLLLGGFRRHHR